MAVGAAYPRGFRAGCATAGIKASGRPDIALVVAERPVPAAAVFARSRTPAPAIAVSRQAIADGHAQAVLVQSGNANAATGSAGRADAEQMAVTAATAIGAAAGDVLVASTGVIGVPLPMERVLPGIEAAAAALAADGGADAATAILTTDAGPKLAQRDAGSARVGGMAKGAGMIRPDLGTMIAVITTDAALDSAAADRILRDAVDRTFNRITVDGCASTSDMVALLASGEAGENDEAAVAKAVRGVCEDLALMIVSDGEGARRIARWRIAGAAGDVDARTLAYAVAESQLVRCALHGGDPNWGRIVAALGAAGPAIDPERIAIAIGGIPLCRDGVAVPVSDPAALDAVAALDVVEVEIGVGDGPGSWEVWGSDLSHAYVDLNAEYTT
ncbi:MAG: bifunctional glutamate N-acetyltransferase/amino-acid acetyltransferase ArgJ [Gaiellales bacterium]